MTTIRQEDFIQSVADAFQFISYYHPKDYIDHLWEAYQKEQSPAAKDAMAQILINSRMGLEGHPDQPEWLSSVNASVLKVKLATAIIGISSIHLLKTFINASHYEDRVIIAQVAIHITFLISVMAIAASDRIMPHAIPEKLRNHP